MGDPTRTWALWRSKKCLDYLNQKEMKVSTLAFLDHLAPGAILYLRSGGGIEAEYLQLQRKTST